MVAASVISVEGARGGAGVFEHAAPPNKCGKAERRASVRWLKEEKEVVCSRHTGTLTFSTAVFNQAIGSASEVRRRAVACLPQSKLHFLT